MSPWEPIRQVLGRIVLLVEKLTQPEPVQRSAEEQAKADALTANWSVYEFKMCPFCMKLRKEIRRKGLNIELRDARHDPKFRQELETEGGKSQVPCLRIEKEDGTSTWMYESSDIIDFLNQQIPEPQA